MKKSLLILIIVAASLTVIGLMLMGISITVLGFDIKNISLSGEYDVTPYEHHIFVEVENIDITSSFQNINILPSTDGKTRVVANETKNIYATVDIQGDTLKIRYIDARMWYDRIGIQLDSMSLNLYLPQTVYNSLVINTSSGDINISNGCTFTETSFNTTSGSIEVFGINSASAVFTATTASGDVELSGCTLASLNISTASGEISLNRCTVGELDADTASGDVELELFDADLIKINTSSGSVDGTLLGEMDYFINTASGKVVTPSSVSGAPECHINTASGDVELSVIGE